MTPVWVSVASFIPLLAYPQPDNSRELSIPFSGTVIIFFWYHIKVLQRIIHYTGIRNTSILSFECIFYTIMHLYLIINEAFRRYQHTVMQILPILMNFVTWHPKAHSLMLPMITWEKSECIGSCHAPSGRWELFQIPIPLGSSSLTLTSAIICFLWVTSFSFVHF